MTILTTSSNFHIIPRELKHLHNFSYYHTCTNQAAFKNNIKRNTQGSEKAETE